MRSTTLIYSIILCLLAASCKLPEVVPQNLSPVKPVIELSGAENLEIAQYSFRQELAQKQRELEECKKIDHLLRLEVDALKKKMIQMEVDYKINDVKKKLDKITKQ